MSQTWYISDSGDIVKLSSIDMLYRSGKLYCVAVAGASFSVNEDEFEHLKELLNIVTPKEN